MANSKMFKELINTLRSIARICKGNKLTLYNKLNELRNQRYSPVLRILGNGETLNNALNLFDESENVDYMVVNRHVFSGNFSVLKPRYYVIADPYFFEKDEGLKILESINEKLKWEMFLLVPFSKRNSTVVKWIFRDNNFIQTYFFNSVPFEGLGFIKDFMYSHNLSMPRPQNVLVAAIYCGIIAKFQRIELFGAEHSWLKYLSVNHSCDVCIEDRHFYDKENVKKKTWNSTHDGDTKLHTILRAFAFMFESYWELQEFSKKEKTIIINFSEESFIDAFEKDSFIK